MAGQPGGQNQWIYLKSNLARIGAGTKLEKMPYKESTNNNVENLILEGWKDVAYSHKLLNSNFLAIAQAQLVVIFLCENNTENDNFLL